MNSTLITEYSIRTMEYSIEQSIEDVITIFHKLAAIIAILIFDTVFMMLPLCCYSWPLFQQMLPKLNWFTAGLVFGLSILELVNDDQTDIIHAISDHYNQNDLPNVWFTTKLVSYFSGIIFSFSFMFCLFIHFYINNKSQLSTVQVNNVNKNDAFQETEMIEIKQSSYSSNQPLPFQSSTVYEIQSKQRQSRTVNENNARITLNDREDQKALVENEQKNKTLRDLMFWVFATSLESFFSCLVLGCQTEERVIWIIFMAILTGDWAECIVLGQKIKQHYKLNYCSRQLGIIFFIQLMSVFGFLVGMLTQLLPDQWQAVISKLLFASLSGIFCYISLVDMIIKDLMDEQYMNLYSFMLLACLTFFGLATSCIINVWYLV